MLGYWESSMEEMHVEVVLRLRDSKPLQACCKQTARKSGPSWKANYEAEQPRTRVSGMKDAAGRELRHGAVYTNKQDMVEQNVWKNSYRSGVEYCAETMIVTGIVIAGVQLLVSALQLPHPQLTHVQCRYTPS